MVRPMSKRENLFHATIVAICSTVFVCKFFTETTFGGRIALFGVLLVCLWMFTGNVLEYSDKIHGREYES
jgi:hypothetical protein